MGCPEPQQCAAATCGLGSDWECSLGREGTTEDPKDKGTDDASRTGSGCSRAVPALLAEQPGDPTEEIGPFKRDSDK